MWTNKAGLAFINNWRWLLSSSHRDRVPPSSWQVGLRTYLSGCLCVYFCRILQRCYYRRRSCRLTTRTASLLQIYDPVLISVLFYSVKCREFVFNLCYSCWSPKNHHFSSSGDQKTFVLKFSTTKTTPCPSIFQITSETHFVLLPLPHSHFTHAPLPQTQPVSGCTGFLCYSTFARFNSVQRLPPTAGSWLMVHSHLHTDGGRYRCFSCTCIS